MVIYRGICQHNAVKQLCTPSFHKHIRVVKARTNMDKLIEFDGGNNVAA